MSDRRVEPLPETLAFPFRRQRAMALTAHVMSLIGYHLERHEGKARREAHQALYEAFYESGVEVITDADRKTAGLLQRGEYGLTAEELQIIEARRTEAILRPMPPILIHEPTPCTRA